MNKNYSTLLFIAGLLTIQIIGFAGCKKKETAKKPNILWIMCDDHTANTISSYKMRFADVIETPNIDRIANEGAMLNNCYVTNSICTPSRATIMTGKYGHKTGVYTLWDDLKVEDETVATLLQKNGYETAMIGKWHLHTQPQGFDYYSVLPGQGLYHNPVFKETGTKWTTGKEGKKYNGYVTDVITDNSLNWLDNREGVKPFFLMLHHKAPHGLWEYAERHEHLYDEVTIPEPESLNEDKTHRSEGSRTFGRDMLNLSQRMYEGKRGKDYPTGKLDIEGMSDEERIAAAYQKYLKDYLRVVAAIDENVGKVLEYLDEKGLNENTIVVYTSDQGMFLGEHSYYDKRWIYDESLKMPFLIRKPDEIKAGSQCDDMITNLDFAELILDYGGVTVPNDMQGKSFRKNLIGKTPEDWQQSMYYHYWMQFEGSEVPAHFGVRTHDYKLIFFYGRGMGLNGTTEGWNTPIGWELYDLKNDPNEMNNIYGKSGYDQITKELKTELKRLQTKYEVNLEDFPELQTIINENWNK
ncbi:sulfatase [Labilibacter sediminis]|nr:sulfatase [Labilibacter sediminis]